MKKYFFYLFFFSNTFLTYSNDWSFSPITETWYPFNYQVRESPRGISIDILRKVFERSNLEIHLEDFKFYPWARAYHVAKNTPNSILFTTLRTENRENEFKWLGPIYIHKTEAFALNMRNIVIENYKDFDKYIISTYLGDAQEELIQNILGINIEKLDRIPNPEGRFLKVLNGRSDIFFSSRISLISFSNTQNIDISALEAIYELSRTGAYFAFPINTPDFIISNLNEILRDLHEENYILELFKKYKIEWAYELN